MTPDDTMRELHALRARLALGEITEGQYARAFYDLDRLVARLCWCGAPAWLWSRDGQEALCAAHGKADAQ